MSEVNNPLTNNLTSQPEPYTSIWKLAYKEEISKAIYSLDDKKSPGPDGLGASTIKIPIVIRYLHQLYNRHFKNADHEIPSDRYLSSLNGNKHDPKNHRGIAMKSCIVKGFCNNRLTTYTLILIISYVKNNVDSGKTEVAKTRFLLFLTSLKIIKRTHMPAL